MTVGAGISLSPTERDPLAQNRAIRQLMEGRSNALVEASLDANATSTLITAPTCGTGSGPVAVPMTANAVAAMADMYVASVSNGSFLLMHASSSTTDRTFRFVIIG